MKTSLIYKITEPITTLGMSGTIPYHGQVLGVRFHVQMALSYAIEISILEAGQNPEVLEVKFHERQ